MLKRKEEDRLKSINYIVILTKREDIEEMKKLFFHAKESAKILES
jgi:hypothetical protein